MVSEGDSVPGEARVTNNTTHLPRSNTVKRNRTYGFLAETELMEYLRNHGVADVEKLSLAGTEDEGDLVIDGASGWDTLVQLKTFAPRTQKGADRALTPGLLNRWLKAQQEQAANYKAHRDMLTDPDTFLVVKIKGQSWDDAYVIQRLKNVVEDA
jgi:hypothetical protein